MGTGLKYDLNEEDLEILSKKIEYIMNEQYKDKLSTVPEHIKHTLCQNFVLQCKNNKMDIDTLLNEAGISD
jgi:GTPase SAR1 family protein